MHKLTEAHIRPDSFQKMNAKLAMQVFSHHVSTAIFAASTTNLFDEKEKSTAQSTVIFFYKLNKLCENLNSQSKFSSNPDNCALADNEILSNGKKQPKHKCTASVGCNKQ